MGVVVLGRGKKLKRSSIIFSNKELKILERKFKGLQYVDYDGQFGNRIVPKVKELLVWSRKVKLLKKVLGVKK